MQRIAISIFFLKNDLKMYNKIFDTNVKGMFFLLQAVAKEMIKRKIKGNIINLSSQAGRRGGTGTTLLCIKSSCN